MIGVYSVIRYFRDVIVDERENDVLEDRRGLPSTKIKLVPLFIYFERISLCQVLESKKLLFVII